VNLSSRHKNYHYEFILHRRNIVSNHFIDFVLPQKGSYSFEWISSWPFSPGALRTSGERKLFPWTALSRHCGENPLMKSGIQ
jgi:hypothetical protein